TTRTAKVEFKEVIAMEVILLEKIANLGSLGDKVAVKSGYARNFLLPFGKATPATAANIEAFEARRAELEKIAAAKTAEAEARAAKLADVTLSISAKACEDGKLLGPICSRDIADAVTAAGVELEKCEVRLPEGPLRNVGEFDVAVQLHTDVETTVKVVVVAG